MKKFLALLLASVMLLGCFVACTGNGNEENTGTTDGSGTTGSEPTEAPTEEPTEEPTETESETETETETETEAPEDPTVYMYYDDRITLKNLLELEADTTEFELKDVKITSKVVGKDEADTALLTFDEATGRVIASATGTSTLVVGGVEYPLVVSPAPISLFLITGHSLGEGSQGNLQEAIVCPQGQVYGTHRLYESIAKITATTGLGYYAETRPGGIDAFTKEKATVTGRPGIDTGLAKTWNELTGEKVWVVNAAQGGSVIKEWLPNGPYHLLAMTFLNNAAQILKQEVTAGHYEFKDMAVLYFSGANFAYKGVIYDDQNEFDSDVNEWYNKMWNGYQNGCKVDINGDGKVDAPSTLGLVPIWETKTTDNVMDNGYRLNKYIFDKSNTFWMAASKDYPYAFTATNISSQWMTDDNVKNNFPAFNYTMHYKDLPAAPTKMTDVIADGVHLTQIGYNAAGIDIAKNLYAYLRTENAATGVKVLNITTNPKGDEVKDTLTITAGQQTRLVFVTEPISASNLTFEVSDNLKLNYNGVLTASGAGTGTITISYEGTVLKTINVTIK